MELKISFYHSNADYYIEISNDVEKYNISSTDLFEYLRDKNCIIQKSNIQTSEEPSTFIDDFLKEEKEPIDKLTNLNDNQLISFVSKLLEKGNKLNISEYYKKKYNESIQFNLRGLILNNSIRNNSDSARKKIRNLGRKCIEFLEIKNKTNNQNIQNKQEIISIEQINIPSQQPSIKIESFPKTCIYKFKRLPKRGEVCGMATIKDQPYCKKCYDHVSQSKSSKSK
jgi:hypothetical protein